MYGVIILNYNTAQDALLAAQSVADNATKRNFCICIVDNNSSRANERKKLEIGIKKISNTELLFLHDNKGYAYGNNEGVKYITLKYDIDYVVIMNPDVIIKEKDTIESLISEIKWTDYCGVQPIVWTQSCDIPKEMQTSIRRYYSYKDCLIEHNCILKRMFWKWSRHQVFYEQRPYKENVEFEVPSGAFFIVKVELIQQLKRLFDDRTFLYDEELILGYRLHELNKKMLFVPSEYVIHEGGKSIGSNSKHITKFAVLKEIKSINLYLREYLKCNWMQIKLVDWAKYIDFYIKQLSYRLHRL